MNLREGIETLTGDELVRFLATYEYAPSPARPAAPAGAGELGRWTTEVEDQGLGGDETFDEVTRAWNRGKLEDSTYYAVLNLLGGGGSESAPPADQDGGDDVAEEVDVESF